MQNLIVRQRNFFNSQQTKDIAFRIEQLHRLETLLKANENLLYEAIYKDFRKSEFETMATELAIIYRELKHARMNVRQWAGKQRVTTNLLNFPAKSYVIPEPLGTALIIGASNYPYLLSISPMIAAIAAGCTVILKPSEIASHTSSVMASLLNGAFDPKYICVVEGGIPETTALLQQKFDKIFFTGSPAVGTIIARAAAQHLTAVTLELGGKSPAIVMDDCDLKMTVKRLVWAKFLNAGQTCIAPDYVLVQAGIKEDFLKLCVAEIEKQQFELANENYVQIIDKKGFNRLKSYLKAENIYYGGSFDEEKRVIAPTILQYIDLADAVMREEIFGPILPVLPFDTEQEVIEQVRSLPEPLSAYVFSGNKRLRNRLVRILSFGNGGINEAVMQITNPHLPFGGVGSSGTGAYHGEAGFRAFTHYKSIIDKPTWFELNLKYFPYSKTKAWWIRKLFKF